MANNAATIDRTVLKAYYDTLPKEFGFASRCKMTLLGDIVGKRVLDIDCRRGKGVIKLSDYVGPRGFVLGVDPSPEWIEIARSFMDDAWRRNGLPFNNMNYAVAYPEDLAAAGVADESFDLVFTNSSISLDYDMAQVLREAFRALRPGGLLVFDGVVAEGPRDAATVARARAIGNAVQASPSRLDFDCMVTEAGFYAPEYYEESFVRPHEGYRDDYEVSAVESDENVRFVKTTARICKPR